jgi:lantibiotic modifying enzyme
MKLKWNLGFGMGLAALLTATVAFSGVPAGESYRNAALATATWLQRTAVPSKGGIAWPADPKKPDSVDFTLYSGTPGPILFFLEAYRYTGNPTYLKEARRGADALLAASATSEGAGLYDGMAGTGYTLGEAYLVTKEPKYREGALQCVRWLQHRAKTVGKGVEWSDTTDIISGSSGTGLFLLWAANNLQAPGARKLAIETGERLLEVAHPAGKDKLKWINPTYPREMPNFSHGTAGVAYFMATLYLATHRQDFLNAALGGANYLLSIADLSRSGCMVFHDNQRKDLYYLGWCHGPAGTARLFYRLYEATHDPVWMEWMKKAATAIMENGGPDKVVTPGEWDNVGMCCGVAAEAEFFLDMYSVTHDPQYLNLSKKASDQLLALASTGKDGNRWKQAENRIDPNVLIAQTGYMQGASGIGMWLLHLDNALHGGNKPVIRFPDNPFKS